MTDRRTIENLKKRYPQGIRVILVRMDDVQAPPVGSKGTVIGVDDIGSIHVQWDNICGIKNIHLYQKIFKNKQTF